MPYITSPMEKYNKNNPFIIIAKKQYYTVIDSIQDWTKDYIFHLMIELVLLLSGIALSIYMYIKSNESLIFIVSVNILLSAAILLLYIRFKRKIRGYLHEHSSMKEFDRLSKLEINEILTLNNENLFECIHGLYQIYGEIIKEHFYYKEINIAIITFQICNIISLLVIICQTINI